MPPPETPGHSQTSLRQSLVGTLSPGVWRTQASVVPSKSLFPQSCVSSGSSMVGLMVPPPRGLMPPPRELMPYPGLLHSETLPLLYSTVDQYLCSRQSDTVLAQYLWGLWVLVAQGLSEPSNHLWRVWSLILNVILPLLLSSWGFFFAL